METETQTADTDIDANVEATDAAQVDEAPARTFTQADVDRIVQERLARAKSTPPPDYDDLKEKAAEFDKLQESNRSDLERATERAEKAEALAAEATEKAHGLLVQAAVVAAATSAGALAPGTIHKLIDTAGVTVEDDGTVTGAEDAVKAFLKANPDFVGTSSDRSADQGARGGGSGGQLTRDQLKTMSPEQIVQARKEGRIASVMGT